MDSITAISVGAAVAIVLVNFVLAYRSTQQALGKPAKEFLATALKGMGLRMVLMVLMVIAVASLMPVDLRTFGFALVAGLIIGLIVEIILLKKVVNQFANATVATAVTHDENDKAEKST